MKKRSPIAILVGLAIAICMLISACGGNTGSGGSTPTVSSNSPKTLGTPGNYTCVSGSITVGGSTALQPLVNAVAKKYQAKCSSATITVQGGGSKTGLGQVEAGVFQIGDSDIFALSNQSDLVDHQVAVVVFTLVVNPDVTGVSSLTSQQILGIYTGKYTNWNQVGGPNLPIVVVSRPATSGTRATFKQYVLNGTSESPAKSTNLTADSTKLVLQTVEQTNGAIGYAALGDASQEGSKVTILQIDGVAPSADTVKTNTYKFWNIEHMYTKGPGTGLAQALIDYMLSPDGKAAAQDLKFVPITDMTQDALSAHQPKS